MKLLLSLMIAGTALFAGGDILPVQIMEKPVMQKQAPTRGCYKPNIQKCPECVDVAEICPDNPELPMAQTEPCEVSINR
ncbi:MAG: Unknown protein [uncultured Sulfurovum sp.]|uniref:Uncharacterized protein n=1 Tax=uncultured Sulfurovum sp. TaxID=269237 RepID=A0A6S6TJH5_9BACT|nr:MAG: Unknown protein [uncultured Sulfurovum sp.]